MPTYTIFADTAATSFGKITSSQTSSASSWTTVTNGSNLAVLTNVGTTTFQTAYTPPAKGSDSYKAEQVFLQFDCSSVPSTDTVTGVAYSHFEASGPAAVPSDAPQSSDVLGFNYGGTIETTDYRTAAQVAALTRLATLTYGANSSSGGSNTYQAFTENGSNFSAAILKGGGAAMTRVMIVARQSASTATPPTGNNQRCLSAPNQANPPKLVITTTAGAASPQTVSPSGIATAESLGNPTVTVAPPPAAPQTVSPTGISTVGAVGTPLVSVANAPQTISLAGQGIPSAAAAGSPQVSVPFQAGLLVKVLQNGVWVASDGGNVSVRRVTAAGSPVTARSYELLVVDASGGPVQVIAPGHGNGICFAVKKSDPSANAVTVTGNSFDGAGSYQITQQGRSQDFVSDGAAWLLV